MQDASINSSRASTSEDDIIVVSGLPRSGTSMMMAMLRAGGIPLLTDEIRVPDEDNPKGYYEYERVKKLAEGDLNWLSEAQGKAVKIISYLLMKIPASFNYRVIFIHRRLDEILASQRKMLLNRGEDPDKTSEAEIRAVLTKHLHQVAEWIRAQPNIEHLEVNYNQMLEEPDEDIQRIAAFLGGSMEPHKLTEVIDSRLYRQRRTE